MNRAKNLFLTSIFVGSLLLISLQQASSVNTFSKNTLLARIQPTAIDEWKIRDIAKQITVRVFSQENTASGIIIDKKKVNRGEYLYLVVTNNHVVANQEPDFSVETPDGKVYKASIYPSSKVKSTDNIDLKLLYFSSSIAYEKALLGNSSNIQNEDDVFVAGFACQVHSCETENEFIFKPGTALLLGKPLVKGYQLGFTSETKIGTSGGAVLDKKGQLVAINGRGKYPILNGQYTYIDGTQPSPDLQKFMRHFAWGIPINTYYNWASKNPLDNISIPFDVNHETAYLSQKTYSSKDLSNEQIIFLSLLIFLLIIITIIFPITILFNKHNSKENQPKLSFNDQIQHDIYSASIENNSNTFWSKFLKNNSKLELELIEIKSMLQNLINNNQNYAMILHIEKFIDELKNDNNLLWSYAKNEIQAILNQHNQHYAKFIKMEKLIHNDNYENQIKLEQIEESIRKLQQHLIDLSNTYHNNR